MNFRLAKACSGKEDTVHYMYSMNWITKCYGSHIFGNHKAVHKDKRQVYINGGTGSELVKATYQLTNSKA